MKLSTYRGGTTPRVYNDTEWWEGTDPVNAESGHDGAWETYGDDIKTAGYSQPIGKCRFGGV